MSADDTGHQIGFWRDKSHRKKLLMAEGFTVEKAIERVRRRRLVDYSISTAVGVLGAIGVLVVVYMAIVLATTPAKREEPEPVERILYRPAPPVRAPL